MSDIVLTMGTRRGGGVVFGGEDVWPIIFIFTLQGVNVPLRMGNMVIKHFAQGHPFACKLDRKGHCLDMTF